VRPESWPPTDDGLVFGFDGSEHAGHAGIAEQLNKIFANRDPSLRRQDQECHGAAARSGHRPRRGRHAPAWLAQLHQNIPAQFHGRPEAVDELTAELRAVLEDAE